MPLYDYRCGKCGVTSEILVHGIGAVSVKCPECGSDDMEQLMTAAYSFRMGSQEFGTTCCGRPERCDAPACATGASCRREHQ